MVDIQKLANLTGIQLSPEQETKLGLQIQSVISLLEQVKDYDLPTSDVSWHEVVGLASVAQQAQIPDADPDAILANVDHPLLGHAVQVKAFVE